MAGNGEDAKKEEAGGMRGGGTMSVSVAAAALGAGSAIIPGSLEQQQKELLLPSTPDRTGVHPPADGKDGNDAISRSSGADKFDGRVEVISGGGGGGDDRKDLTTKKAMAAMATIAGSRVLDLHSVVGSADSPTSTGLGRPSATAAASGAGATASRFKVETSERAASMHNAASSWSSNVGGKKLRLNAVKRQREHEEDRQKDEKKKKKTDQQAKLEEIERILLKADTGTDDDDDDSSSDSDDSASDTGEVSDQGDIDSSEDEGSDESDDEDDDSKPRFARKNPFRRPAGSKKRVGSMRKAKGTNNEKKKKMMMKPAAAASSTTAVKEEMESTKRSAGSKKVKRLLSETEEDLPNCDICAYPPSYRNLRYQKCSDCGVLVHEPCYGIAPYPGLPGLWKCHGCKAIGKIVEGRARGESTRRSEKMQQYRRPRVCELCNVRTGTHAMHPLYDYDGEKGRQLILPAVRKAGGLDIPRRLAWTHSLCAFFITSFSTTKGCVYACNRRGQYFEDTGHVGDVGGNDNDGKGKTSNFEATHHFVIAGRQYPRHYEVICDLREGDGCEICGESDRRSLRIPVECSTGNSEEHLPFMQKHKTKGYLHCNDNPDGYNCHRPMHVGCAVWGGPKNDGAGRFLVFNPGTPDEKNGVGCGLICECYCQYHSAEVKAWK